ETNNLAVIFEQIRKMKERAIDHANTLISTFLEPALIIFTGMLVAVILIAMYMPMFSLNETMGL
ncbi:MAG: type II secretion system F family protein, partial [Bacteroidales bacterium]|nr:type II secretion system F family protein [Bacteroidales bacterium]